MKYSEDPGRVSPAGYFTYAKQYLDAARHLDQLDRPGDTSNRMFKPIWTLLGVSIELFFKSRLLSGGASLDQLKGFGHDLSKLWVATKALDQNLEESVTCSLSEFWEQNNLYNGSNHSRVLKEILAFDVENIVEYQDLGKTLLSPDFIVELLQENYGQKPFRLRYFERGAMSVISNGWLIEFACSLREQLAPLCELDRRSVPEIDKTSLALDGRKT